MPATQIEVHFLLLGARSIVDSIRKKSLRRLSDLVPDSTNQRLIIRVGGMEALLSLLSSTDVEVLEDSIYILSHLVVSFLLKKCQNLEFQQ